VENDHAVGLSSRIDHGGPLTGHTGPVIAAAAGAQPDGTPVIISGSWDRTPRVWWLADSAPADEPLDLFESVWDVIVDGNMIVTAAGDDIAVHQLALPQPIR
jgi:uncharacterized Zn-binding protein involved in type VI secretion